MRDKCGRSQRSKGSFRRAETLAELTLLHAKGEKPRKPREPCLSLHRLDTKKVRAYKLWDAIGSRNLAISMDFISHCSVAQKSTKFLFEFVRFLPQPSQTQSWEFSSATATLCPRTILRCGKNPEKDSCDEPSQQRWPCTENTRRRLHWRHSKLLRVRQQRLLRTVMSHVPCFTNVLQMSHHV